MGLLVSGVIIWVDLTFVENYEVFYRCFGGLWCCVRWLTGGSSELSRQLTNVKKPRIARAAHRCVTPQFMSCGPSSGTCCIFPAALASNRWRGPGHDVSCVGWPRPGGGSFGIPLSGIAPGDVGCGNFIAAVHASSQAFRSGLCQGNSEGSEDTMNSRFFIWTPI